MARQFDAFDSNECTILSMHATTGPAGDACVQWSSFSLESNHPFALPTQMDSQQSRVLVQLRDLLLKGEFVRGERLAEIPLAEKLGASRTPVRLALTSLEHEGLIEQSPGGGHQMRR